MCKSTIGHNLRQSYFRQMPFVTVKQARRLTGLSDHVVRKWLREIMLYGSETDKKKLIKKKGKWLLDLELVDKLAERDRPEESKPGEEEDKEHFGLPRLDHPLIGLLQRQLINKDQQMDRLHTHIDSLLERNRELNVMLHKLQQQFGDLGMSATQVVKDTGMEKSRNKPDWEGKRRPEQMSENPAEQLQEREFTQWLRSL